MNLTKARDNLKQADGAIRQWFLVNEDTKIVLELIERARTAETLDESRAKARAALMLFGKEENEGALHHDEMTIVRRLLKDTLAELEYQAQAA